MHEDAKIAGLVDLFSKGLVTMNQAREAIGLPPTPKSKPEISIWGGEIPSPGPPIPFRVGVETFKL